MATEQQTQDQTADATNASGNSDSTGADSLTVTDNRTGKTYELPISDGTVRAMDLRQIKVDEDEFGMLAYDPAFTNTASCRSAVTYIDGAAGVLEHRGYSIRQLCERSTFLEVAHLLIFRDLPRGRRATDLRAAAARSPARPLGLRLPPPHLRLRGPEGLLRGLAQRRP